MRRKAGRSRYKRKQLLYRLLSIVAFFALLGGVYEAVRIVQFHLEAQNLRKEIEFLESENRHLEETREKLENDPAEIERRAREDLGMMKDGERVYRRIEPRAQGSDGGGGDSE